MFKALMLFMPCVPSQELLLAMRARYGLGRVDVVLAGPGRPDGRYFDLERVSKNLRSVIARPAPETREFIELMGEFSRVRMGHRYTYYDVLTLAHQIGRDVEHSKKSGAREGPVHYSAFGDGTPYATPEDADNAAAMLKAVTQTSS